MDSLLTYPGQLLLLNSLQKFQHSPEDSLVLHPGFQVGLTLEFLTPFSVEVKEVVDQPLNSGQSVFITNSLHNLLNPVQVSQFRLVQ